MKRTKLLKGLLLGGVILSASVANAQFSTSSPGGSSNSYTTGTVGIGSYPSMINVGYSSIGSPAINSPYMSFISPSGNWHHIHNYGGNLRFSVGGSPANSGLNNYMTIDNVGNIGIQGSTYIGGTTPGAYEPLEIQGNKAGISLYDRSGGSTERWVLYSNRTNSATAGSNTFRIYTGGQDRFAISSNGNVGIGTVSPDSKFNVQGDDIVINTGGVNLGGFNVNGQTSQYTYGFATSSNKNLIPLAGFGFTKHSNNTNSPVVWMYGGGNTYNAFQVRSAGWNDASLSASSLHFSVNSNGQVYVGDPTTAQQNANGFSSCKLFVTGKIGATEVVVSTTDWSDYVFDESYKLPSLVEVDAYIKANKHLPAVPSEKEVVENGVNTGEMLKTHMRKIEELTLYVIELKKEIEALKK